MNKTTQLIFVVDDNDMYRAMLQKVIENELKKEGIHSTVKDFPDAAQCLRSLDEEPNVIVLDYFFESEYNDSMDGFHLLKKIKMLAPSAEVIILSGVAKDEMPEKLLKEGALTFIEKDENGQTNAAKKTIEILKNKNDEK